MLESPLIWVFWGQVEDRLEAEGFQKRKVELVGLTAGMQEISFT